MHSAITGRGLGLLLPALLLLPTVRASDTYVYVQDREDGNGSVHAWHLDEDTGSLVDVPGMPFATASEVSGSCGGFCMTMAAGEVGKGSSFLFTAQVEGVVVWAIDPEDGSLTEVHAVPVDGGLTDGNFSGLGTVRLGKRLFLYAASFDTDQVVGFEVMEDGELVQVSGSPYSAGEGPDGLDARGKVVVVCNETEGTLSSWSVQKDGSLEEAPGSPFAIGAGFAYNVQLDEKGKLALVTDASDDDLFVFEVNSKDASLAPAADSPIPNGVDGGGMGTEAGKKLLLTFLSSGDRGDPDVALHRVSKKGAERLGRQVTGLAGIVGHAYIEKSGLLVVATDGTTAPEPSVRLFRVDRKTGAMLLLDEASPEFVGVNDAQLVEL